MTQKLNPVAGKIGAITEAILEMEINAMEKSGQQVPMDLENSEKNKQEVKTTLQRKEQSKTKKEKEIKEAQTKDYSYESNEEGQEKDTKISTKSTRNPSTRGR